LKSSLIYWPILALLAVPLWVLILNGKRKGADRKQGVVSPDSPINNKAWSLPVVLSSNALENQFQLPIVFYVLCFILVDLNAVSPVLLALCWAFVISRWVHAYVHVTTNFVPLRARVFIFGVMLLLALFAMTAWALMHH